MKPFSGIRAFGHSGIRAFGHSGIRAFGHSGIRAFGHSGIREVRRWNGRMGLTHRANEFSIFNPPRTYVSLSSFPKIVLWET